MYYTGTCLCHCLTVGTYHLNFLAVIIGIPTYRRTYIYNYTRKYLLFGGVLKIEWGSAVTSALLFAVPSYFLEIYYNRYIKDRGRLLSFFSDGIKRQMYARNRYNTMCILRKPHAQPRIRSHLFESCAYTVWEHEIRSHAFCSYIYIIPMYIVLLLYLRIYVYNIMTWRAFTKILPARRLNFTCNV